MKRQPFIAILMILLGLGACDFPPNLSQRFQNVSPQPALTIVSEEQVALAEAVMWAKPPKVVFKRDIFKPLIASSATSSQGGQAVVASDVSMLELSGTLVSENPVAFIRNTAEKKNYVVREKGFVSSFQVMKIDQKGVRLQKDGKDFYLKIPEAKK
jgi:hypothetical protein